MIAMRMMMRSLVMGALLVAGVGAAGAQVLDPTTGLTVDAASDPMDFSAVVSGQPGNVGIEAMANANAASASFQASMDADADNAAPDIPAAPALPSTPKPLIGPAASKFVGSVQVTIADADAGARIFYTLDGRKPTESSAMYAGPVAVSTKTKVEALAWDVNERPSGVASRTYKVGK
jgi:fibronectin-binding autotransporter adhesin